MKKIGTILLLVLFAVAMLCSCKSAENCPAYADNQVAQEVEEVVA